MTKGLKLPRSLFLGFLAYSMQLVYFSDSGSGHLPMFAVISVKSLGSLILFASVSLVEKATISRRC